MSILSEENRARLLDAEKRARLRIFRLVRDRDEADDIIQEAYARLCAFGGPINDVAGLLITTAYHIAVDEREKRDTRADTCLGGAHLFEEVIEEGVDPERTHMAWQELQQIQAFVNSLHERRRQAFVLIQVLGYSYGEAAAFMGVTVGTLESHIRASRHLMRQDWGDQVSRYKRGFYTPRSARSATRSS